jgi:hypothetical protein
MRARRRPLDALSTANAPRPPFAAAARRAGPAGTHDRLLVLPTVAADGQLTDVYRE